MIVNYTKQPDELAESDLQELEERSMKTTNLLADVLINEGSMNVFMNHCATGYIMAFHVRAMLSKYLKHGDERWMKAAKDWAHLSIRMQGTYGDPAAYNMGYAYVTRDGTPEHWFLADTFDQASSLLLVAHLLEPSDPLYLQILESVLRFDEYIQQWNLGEDGFANAFKYYENRSKSCSIAISRAPTYYAIMHRVFGKKTYRDRAVLLLNHLIDNDDFERGVGGSPTHNRHYAGDALVSGYYLLAGDDEQLKKRIVDKVRKDIIPWAFEKQLEEGYWAHDRGNDVGSTTATKKFGSYSVGIVYCLQMLRHELDDVAGLDGLINRFYSFLVGYLDPEDTNRWGCHAWLSLLITARAYPECLLPICMDRVQR
jgi:hypothetical protein